MRMRQCDLLLVSVLGGSARAAARGTKGLAVLVAGCPLHTLGQASRRDPRTSLNVTLTLSTCGDNRRMQSLCVFTKLLWARKVTPLRTCVPNGPWTGYHMLRLDGRLQQEMHNVND